jgi:predicted acetyltransferase
MFVIKTVSDSAKKNCENNINMACNKPNFQLKKLSSNDGQEIYELLQTMPKDENGLLNNANGLSYEEFKNWLAAKEKESEQKGLVDGWKVPSTTFWLYVDDLPVGFGNLRHFLTDALRKAGGNIGYGIAPQYRGKGYGKELLRLLLKEAAKIGLEKVLITVHLDNIASQKVALANGGTITEKDDERVFIWIETKNEKMTYILETERLKLRELTLADTEKLSLVLSDVESMKFYPHPFSREEVENWIKWNIDNYKKYGFGLWAVIEKDSDEFIGDCGITMQQVEDDLFPEIGYHLRKEFRGKGYATEAARACSDFAKSRGIKQIISYMKSDNLPSRHVAERNGMTYVKSFTKTVMGKVVEDEVLYMKTL